MSDKSTLLEFGFSQLRVEKALKATNNSGLQPALDWLDKHADDPDIDNPIEETAETSDKAEEGADAKPAEGAEGTEAQSLVCNECGKQFKNEDLAQYHAVKSGHTDFAQSTEAVKPLSEEEKAEKLKQLQDRIKEKRQKREAAEKEEQRQNELIRRKAGQDQSAQQEKLKEDQILRDIEKRKREKENDKIAARKIKEQIEQDKKDRAARFAREKAERDGTAVPKEPKPAVVSTAHLQSVSSTSDQARLQIRPLLTGDGVPTQPLARMFGANQTLKDVFDYIRKEIPSIGHHFKLSTTFPRKEFSAHHESKTLKELGLVPSASLILTK